MKINGTSLWWAVLAAGFLPLLLLLFDAAFEGLGGNPIQAIHIRLGDWALRFLWLTLAITPLQTLTQWRGMADFRQLLGIFSCIYASLHLLAYLAVDHAWQWSVIGMDIFESGYMWFGIVAYAIILALGLTTTKASKKLLGKRWKKLHRWIYVAAVAGLTHYFWQLKGNLLEPVFYLLVIIVLFSFRLLVWLKTKYFARLALHAAKPPTRHSPVD